MRGTTKKAVVWGELASPPELQRAPLRRVGSCADPGHWCDENAKWSAECYKKCHEDFKGEDKKVTLRAAGRGRG